MPNPQAYGRATLEPAGPIWAGSAGCWLLTIVIGDHGLDDGGAIALVRRDISDWEIPQFDRPRESGYVTAETDGPARLRLTYSQSVYVRPWRAGIVLEVYDGALAPGNVIWMRLGDTRQGGPGMRAQTFPERAYEFKLLVDPFGTGQYYPLEPAPVVPIIGGPAELLQVVAPSIVAEGETFSIHVRALDSYGNPSSTYQQPVQLRAEGIAGLPDQVTFSTADQGVLRVDGLRVEQPGRMRVSAQDAAGRRAESNPILATAEPASPRLFWGDLHGQTGETIGTGSIEEYLRFGRDVAALDFIGWQGNDFQISNKDWENIQRRIQDYHQPGRYVTFLGYEWSGLTPAGGDHNLHFLGDREPLHRSSHWLVADKSDEAGDRYPLSALLTELRGRADVMLVPHVGGRHANLDTYDAELMPVLELHSHHGTFEWLAYDALRRGLRVGFIAGSDDHTCRPGLSFPTREASRGLASFDVRGGLTAVYADKLTRDALWTAIHRRHVYATTGERIALNVRTPEGAMMGDALRGPAAPWLKVEVSGTAPIISVEIMRGTDVIQRWPAPEQVAALPLDQRRLAILWSGVRVRGRSKKARWDGTLTIENGSFQRVEPFAFDRPDEGVTRQSTQLLTWRSTTSGDPDGILIELEGGPATRLRFASQPIGFTLSLDDIDGRLISLDAGGVNLRVQLFWTPCLTAVSDLALTFQDTHPLVGAPNDYWVRVLQMDGHMAWSSPLFFDQTGEALCD